MSIHVSGPAVCIFALCGASSLHAESFVRGDTNGSGSLNLTDAIVIFGYLFTGESTIGCLDAADVDDSGGINISDGIEILSFLFLDSAAPKSPFPDRGFDPTSDSLSCGPPGSSLEFNGANDSVMVPHSESLVFGLEITVSCWLFLTGGSGSILQKWEDGNEDTRLMVVDRRLIFNAIGEVSNESPLRSRAPLPLNEWVHVVCTASSKVAKLFLNGELDSQVATGGGRIASGRGPMRVGAIFRDSALQLPVSGRVDELAIYRRALTDEEASLAPTRCLTGKEAGLVAYYAFDEGEGQVAADLTDNRNNGTLGSSSARDDADPQWAEGNQVICDGS